MMKTKICCGMLGVACVLIGHILISNAYGLASEIPLPYSADEKPYKMGIIDGVKKAQDDFLSVPAEGWFVANNITDVGDERRMLHKNCPKSLFFDKYYCMGYEKAYQMAWDIVVKDFKKGILKEVEKLSK
jgi:hypothetical protein